MTVARYRLTEASKLQILAALAAAKGQGELAADILRAARILLGSRERSSSSGPAPVSFSGSAPTGASQRQ